MDRFDEMRAKSQKSNNNEYANGNLPMPISSLNFTQTKYIRGKGVVEMNIPNGTTSVDLLVKEMEEPSSLNDYTFKIELGPNETKKEIVFPPNEKNCYKPKYGMWAISKNESGMQTALNYSNKISFDFSYSGNTMTANFNGSMSSTTSGTLVTRRMGKYLFLSSSNTFTGLFVIDTETNEMKQITTLNTNWSNVLELEENIFLVSTSDVAYLYNNDTGEFNLVAEMGGYNKIEFWNKKGIITSTNTSAGILIYNEDGTFENIGYSKHSIIKTSSGIFVYCASYSNVANKEVYLFNSDNNTLDEVLFDDNTSYDAVGSKIVVDNGGTIWLSRYQGTTSQPVYYYTGGAFKKQSTVPYMNFYNSKVFDMYGDKYYVSQKRLFKIAGGSITEVSSSFKNILSGTIVYTFKQGEGYVIISSGYSYFYDGTTATEIYSSLLSTSSVPVQIDDAVYIAGNSLTIKIENGTYVTVSSSYALSGFQKVGGEIFAYRMSSPYSDGRYVLYHLKNDSFEQVVQYWGNTKEATLSLFAKDNLIYLVPNISGGLSYAADSYVKVKTYNLTDGTITDISTIKGGKQIGIDFYAYSDKYIYSIENENGTPSGLTSATHYQNGVAVAQVTSAGISVAYQI